MDKTLTEFKDQILDYMNQFIIPDDTIIREVIFNENEQTNRGHVLQVRLKDKTTASPLFYIEELYEQVKQGRSVPYIAESMRAQTHQLADRLKSLTEIMQENCTVKKSDVRAVLTELVSTMKTSLQNGMRVKLDGFGSFKIGMSTKAADSAKEFSVGKNIKGLRVIFQPEVHIDAVHKRTKTFLAGCTVKEADPYEVDKSEEEEVKP